MDEKQFFELFKAHLLFQELDTVKFLKKPFKLFNRSINWDFKTIDMITSISSTIWINLEIDLGIKFDIILKKFDEERLEYIFNTNGMNSIKNILPFHSKKYNILVKTYKKLDN